MKFLNLNIYDETLNIPKKYLCKFPSLVYIDICFEVLKIGTRDNLF